MDELPSKPRHDELRPLHYAPRRVEVSRERVNASTVGGVLAGVLTTILAGIVFINMTGVPNDTYPPPPRPAGLNRFYVVAAIFIFVAIALVIRLIICVATKRRRSLEITRESDETMIQPQDAPSLSHLFVAGFLLGVLVLSLIEGLCFYAIARP